MNRRLLAAMFAVALALTAFAAPVLAGTECGAMNMHHGGDGMTRAMSVQHENGTLGMYRAVANSSC